MTRLLGAGADINFQDTDEVSFIVKYKPFAYFYISLLFPLSLYFASHTPHISFLSLCLVYYFACELILLVCCFYLLVQGGSTALMVAAWYGCAAVVAFLVDRGADLDLKNNVSNLTNHKIIKT